MNDLELRTALHRDADLVGSPSPDLLDQLARLRRHQRRQRTGVAAVVLGVALLAGGIPLTQTLLPSSQSAPAAPDLAPTPSVPVVPAVTPPVVPVTPSVSPFPSTPAPVTSSAPVASRAPASAAVGTAPSVAAQTQRTVQAPAAGVQAPACPSLATLRAALPADTSDRRFVMRDDQPVCSGTWAAAGYTETYIVPEAERVPGVDAEYPNGQAGLFRYVGGAWTLQDRSTVCGGAAIPADVRQRSCDVD